MSSILEKIKRKGIPTDSFLHAITYVKNTPKLASQDFTKALTDLTGKTFKFDNSHQARMTYLYVIQERVRSPALSDTDLITVAEQKAIKFMKENSWAFVAESQPATSASGHKKGEKKELARTIYMNNAHKGKKAIVDLYMKELQMTNAGAQTYFHNINKIEKRVKSEKRGKKK